MTQTKYPKAISLIGVALTFTGFIFKLNHLMGAVELFNIGALLLVAGLIWWAVKMIRD